MHTDNHGMRYNEVEFEKEVWVNYKDGDTHHFVRVTGLATERVLATGELHRIVFMYEGKFIGNSFFYSSHPKIRVGEISNFTHFYL